MSTSTVPNHTHLLKLQALASLLESLLLQSSFWPSSSFVAARPRPARSHPQSVQTLSWRDQWATIGMSGRSIVKDRRMLLWREMEVWSTRSLRHIRSRCRGMGTEGHRPWGVQYITCTDVMEPMWLKNTREWAWSLCSLRLNNPMFRVIFTLGLDCNPHDIACIESSRLNSQCLAN